MTAAVELWAPTLNFNRRPGEPAPFPPVRYRPPRNTLDPRWADCRNHRVACDCREAEMAEQLAEYRSEVARTRLMEEAIDAVLLLHAENIPWSSCKGCVSRYPCPTRRLVEHLSWREHLRTQLGGRP